MALERIENLLEKYFAAETSVAEEKELRGFFNSADVPAHLKQYSSLFEYYNEEQTSVPDEQLEAKILAAVQPAKKSGSVVRRLLFPLGIAAAIILFAVTFLMIRDVKHNNKQVIVYDDQKDK